MATSCTSVIGGSHFKTCELRSTKLSSSGHPVRLAFQKKKSNQSGSNRRLSVCAEYSDGGRGGGGDFISGFLLGGAVIGTLGYIFAPQIRRAVLNEDEDGFQRARRPIYYDGGLEKTRETLNAKISQLNSAIDKVSSRLKGGNNAVNEQMETDAEVEATL
ncbi:hypothetical protein NE237_024511 [Protea cynaroides]|uniref:Uncharacterized protein n=1 Tax=Protea cynaroides TaxID=273540 RepID=A0A9Q0H3G6_9MAGN|nr:hypothetical protein NE237_024511 [Protea cynaroides]